MTTKTTPAPVEQIARDAELKACPFCGAQPKLSTFAVPAVVYCEGKECPLGPNRIIKDGFGKSGFETKCFSVEVWNRRQACGQQPAVADGPITEYEKDVIKRIMFQLYAKIVSIETDARWNFAAKALREYLAPTPPVLEPATTNESAWLIELKDSVYGHPMYWNGDVHDNEVWVRDSLRGLRFSRKKDAEKIITQYGWTEAFACEHGWDAAAPHPVRGGEQ